MTSHWDFFAKFVNAELAVGGPDSQFTLMLEHAHYRKYEPEEIVWLIGCYAAHHCGQSAYAIWNRFSAAEVVRKPVSFSGWIERYWRSLPVRPEMRSHRMLEKRVQCLRDFAVYTLDGRWKDGSYDDVWTDSQARVKYYGRYMAIKVLELLHRTVRPDMPSYDIRAKGAWSPRRTLALLYPNDASWLSDRQNNTPDAVEQTEVLASNVIQRLKDDYKISISHFQLQVLLCNYRECLQGRFYPGCGLDEEIEYIERHGLDFPVKPWLKTRKRIFKHRHLGELRGWTGIRKEENDRWIQMAKSRGLDLPRRGS